jgi:transposase
VADSKLTIKQLKAVGLLAEGVSHQAIATQLGVGLRTVERWATRPDVKAAIAETQVKVAQALGDEIFEKCRAALTKGLPRAIRKTVEALDHPDAQIQIRAAEAIARWSGFYQPNKPMNLEQSDNAEQNLKRYLAYLETTNGNGSQHKSIR